MLLLYLLSLLFVTSSGSIYIPLCFYFIGGAVPVQVPEDRIYIPLCFYFIWFWVHYFGWSEKFTFHYASTLSSRRHAIRHDVKHLHSTMLLLYPPFILIVPPPLLIYIPLCFYFIPSRRWQSVTDCSFTFHYASTLSHTHILSNVLRFIYIPLCFYFIFRPGVIRGVLILHLHSTMLLLYRILMWYPDH